jgi:GrpB-like predicted nucleotidyltransferase (UPF0157 family)
MLGLKRGIVELADYTADWASAFADEQRRIAPVVPDCLIEHVGSTSVPGLVAKPIIDIAIGFAPGASPAPLIAALEQLGYHYGGDSGADGGHVLSRRASDPSDDVRTHHLHLVSVDDPQWANYLAFRDHLRRSAAARAAYVEVKRALAARFTRDRPAYSAGKREIVERLLADAREV